MSKWQPRVYKVDGDVQFPYWALAAYDDNGTMHYSRESERKYADSAWLGAKDLAMMINRADLTPATEGTTFTDLPAGRFLTEDDIRAAPRLTQEEFTRNFLAELDGNKPSDNPPAKPPRGPRR